MLLKDSAIFRDVAWSIQDMLTVGEDCFKNMEIHSFLRPFFHFPVQALESVKKAEFRICFGALYLNEEQRSIILQTKTVEFSQNVDGN